MYGISGNLLANYPKKDHVSAKGILIICGLAEKVRSAELGIALLLVGCCHIKLLK
jgi:hypothetical protein